MSYTYFVFEAILFIPRSFIYQKFFWTYLLCYETKGMTKAQFHTLSQLHIIFFICTKTYQTILILVVRSFKKYSLEFLCLSLKKFVHFIKYSVHVYSLMSAFYSHVSQCHVYAHISTLEPACQCHVSISFKYWILLMEESKLLKFKIEGPKSRN